MAKSTSKPRKLFTGELKYKREQNAVNEGIQWEADVPYIHWHIENAKRAAGGGDADTIIGRAIMDNKLATIARLKSTVYAGNTSMKQMKQFSNSITDINAAVSDSEYVMNMLKEMVASTLNFRGKNISAGAVASKISATIAAASKKNNREATVRMIDEVLKLMYDQGLKDLIESLSKQRSKLTPIKQAQLESLMQLQSLLDSNKQWSGAGGISTNVRNVLVDILTEQGLPDFLTACSELPDRAVAQVIDASQLGKVRVDKSSVGGRDTQGKIDTMMTFLMPNGRKITQGISLKSNYAGHAASILTTSILATLNHAAQGNQYAMVNAASLMSKDDLKRWMDWANVDRALQGTMLALKEVTLEDRADLLIEFTTNTETGTFQVHNINFLLQKLAEHMIQTNGQISLGKMGWGMSEKYNAVYAYDRTPFDTSDINEAIAQRSHYTNAWISAPHTVTLDVNNLLKAVST